MSNTLTTVEYDATTGEYDSITKVISQGKVHYVPTEWISPDCEYVKTAEARDEDRWGQYETEINWVDYDAPEYDVPTGKAGLNGTVTSVTFPTLSGTRLNYAPLDKDGNTTDHEQVCVKGCGYRLGWGGFAGDAHDYTIAGMVHWYAHPRKGVVATKNRWTEDAGVATDEANFRQYGPMPEADA